MTSRRTPPPTPSVIMIAQRFEGLVLLELGRLNARAVGTEPVDGDGLLTVREEPSCCWRVWEIVPNNEGPEYGETATDEKHKLPLLDEGGGAYYYLLPDHKLQK